MRNVTTCFISVELVKPDSAETNLQLQSDVMETLAEKGYEVIGSEVIMSRERSMPDKK